MTTTTTKSGISTFSIAATYVGTVVGAGFATGQEVLRFFTHFGVNGIYGAIGATILFAVLGGIVLEVGYKVKAQSHEAVVETVAGPLLGQVLDWVITFFLFASAAVMMAGSGAVFAESFGLSRLLGTVLMAVASGATVMLGLRGVINSISIVAPLLILLVLVVSIGSLLNTGIAQSNLAWSRTDIAASRWWPVSALMYVSYNLLLSVGVLGPLGKAAPDPPSGFRGGFLGGLVLGGGTLLINLALLGGLPTVAGFEVPMVQLARRFPIWLTTLYTVILWAEIYTTAVSGLYGLAARVAGPERRRYRTIVLLATIGALLFSQVGFSTMIGTLLPTVGWLGLVFMGGLLLWRFSPGRRSA